MDNIIPKTALMAPLQQRQMQWQRQRLRDPQSIKEFEMSINPNEEGQNLKK